MNTGHEEGDTCGRDGCCGVIEFAKVEGCSCHISPPCHACTSNLLRCPDCDWEAEEERFNDHILTVNKTSQVVADWRPRQLDSSKIDWRNFSHSNASMIKEGVYPEGTTREEVRKLVDGTFGGRFEYFGDGKFKFIAYTD